jgi:RNA-binding protein YlmH
VIRVRLTRKLAAKMQGVDVSKRKVGDVIELPDEQATLMVQAGWAERVAETERKKAAKRKSKN